MPPPGWLPDDVKGMSLNIKQQGCHHSSGGPRAEVKAWPWSPSSEAVRETLLCLVLSFQLLAVYV